MLLHDREREAHHGQSQNRRNTPAGIYFIYDEAGHLLGEYDHKGRAIQETVWLGDMPVAVLKNHQAYYVYADHLNTPRAISDRKGRVVWRWDSDPFGVGLAVSGSKSTEHHADEDPDHDKQAFVYNLRFPGQYYDSETGLHYNTFRDYDPATGRYIQSDPIGLSGGLNIYTYVGNNPIMYYDPYGLWAWGDPIDQDIVDGVSGFGDTMSFNATNWIRDQAGWNSSVDKCSSAYAGGQWTGVAFGLAMGGVGLGQAGFRAEMGAWKQGGQWFAGGRKMPHFHFGNGPGMGKHHLPYQVSSWYKNFAANVRRGVGVNDLRNLGGAIYGFGVAVFGTETNQ